MLNIATTLVIWQQKKRLRVVQFLLLTISQNRRQENDIPTKIIKENADIFSIYRSFSNMTDVCIFPTPLKLANITHVFKKWPKNSKESYRPISILQIYKKLTKGVNLNKYQITFNKYQITLKCGILLFLGPQPPATAHGPIYFFTAPGPNYFFTTPNDWITFSRPSSIKNDLFTAL